MKQFVGLLEHLAVEDHSRFTSHCFRRGAAADVLEEHGLASMLNFGQWSSPGAAMPYASADEQTARALGNAVLDCSDEEK